MSSDNVQIGYFLDRRFCSHPAIENFNSFLKRAPQAHTIDIIMRVDGVEHRYQADILKYMEIIGLKCDVCGDLHEPHSIPRECETGDGQ